MTIAILLLSLFVYLFSKMAESTSSVYSDLESPEITEFNQQFLNYEGRGIALDPVDNKIHYLTIQDVVTLINIAKDNDENGKMNTSITIWVKLLTGGYDDQWMDKESDRLLLENADKKFKCGYNDGKNTGAGQVGVYINTDTKLVEDVYIEEVNV